VFDPLGNCFSSVSRSIFAVCAVIARSEATKQSRGRKHAFVSPRLLPPGTARKGGPSGGRNDTRNGQDAPNPDVGQWCKDALFDALSRRLIAGAALDVWYRYPRVADPAAPATRPFHELPNVLMTPHVSGWTDGMLDARARLIVENIRRIGCQEAPLNLISS
jgi:hypothetical protein